MLGDKIQLEAEPVIGGDQLESLLVEPRQVACTPVDMVEDGEFDRHGVVRCVIIVHRAPTPSRGVRPTRDPP